jgi:hypothetical protein
MPPEFVVDHRRRSHPAAAAVLVAVPQPQRSVLYGYGPAPRAIRGELLCDEQGHFYEKVGDRVWPVQRFVPGPRTEVVDMAPSPPVDAARLRLAAHRAAGESGDQDPPYRTLWPEPGERRVVVWGHWRTVIARQIRHPSRLRDGHRLAAQVQIYEITRGVDAGAWRQTLSSVEGEMVPLTHDVVARLGLAVNPSRRALASLNAGVELAPGDRVARLQVLSDPTAPRHDVAPALPELRRCEPAARRTAIPDRFMRPWEFVRSRDDAAYLTARAGTAGVFSRLAQRISRWTRRADWQRWRTLLAGRQGDEQLWSVRPPAGSLRDPLVRDWARGALEAAGYDSAALLSEWEIFWRRKGL